MARRDEEVNAHIEALRRKRAFVMAIIEAAEEVIDGHDRNQDINNQGNATGAWIPTSEIEDLRKAIDNWRKAEAIGRGTNE